MRLIFHGELRKLFGESFNMDARTVSEAIEGFSRQASNWPTDMRVSAVGFDTEDKLRESADEVHLMPTVYGGGGKFGSIILGAALIATAVLTGGATSGFFLAAHTSLIITGSVMILQGVVGLFMKSPKIKNSQDPEASKYLSVNKNTTAAGTLATMAWGTIDLAGQWVSLQSDSNTLSFGSFPA